MNRRNRRSRGFTLVEILIALVVLTIGLCGIIALFPAGVYSTRESMDDTAASQIAESVYAAIVVSLREATGTQAIFYHDGTVPTTGYQFNLPQWPPGTPTPTVAQLTKAPTMGTGTPRTILGPAPAYALMQGPMPSHVFSCANFIPPNPISGNPIQVTAMNIMRPTSNFDPTENYNQYSYAFDIIRLSQQSLYEVRIGVYRNYEANGQWPVTPQGTWGGSQWGTGNQLFHVCTSACVTTGQHSRHPNLRHVFRALVAGQ